MSSPDKIRNINDLVAHYGSDAPIRFGGEDGLELTIGSALLMEKEMCEPRLKGKTPDEAARTRWLAGALFAKGTLEPQHRYLLEQPR